MGRPKSPRGFESQGHETDSGVGEIKRVGESGACLAQAHCFCNLNSIIDNNFPKLVFMILEEIPDNFVSVSKNTWGYFDERPRPTVLRRRCTAAG